MLGKTRYQQGYVNGSIQDLLVRPLIEFDECPDYGSRGTDEWNSLLALDWRQFHTLNTIPSTSARTATSRSTFAKTPGRRTFSMVTWLPPFPWFWILHYITSERSPLQRTAHTLIQEVSMFSPATIGPDGVPLLRLAT